MNILKTPQQKLMEEMGVTQATPGYLKTPKQLLLEEARVSPIQYADGGAVEEQQYSPEMLRALLAAYDYMGMTEKPTPEPTFQAQPTTATSYLRDRVASVLGDKPADRLFGTGSEGQQAEYLPLQFMNPLAAAGATIDAFPQMKTQLQEGEPGGALMTGGLAGLTLLPFVKPIKAAAKKISKKIKK